MSTFVLIEKYTVGAGGASSVTLGSGGTIPQTYTDLVVKGSTRSSRSAVFDGIYLQPNNATTNLSYRYLEGNGASASSGSSITGLFLGTSAGATATSNTFNNWETIIPNYTSSNYKSVSSDSGGETNGTTAYADLVAGLWSNTSAITSLVFYCSAGNSFVQYSTFYLYGILKA